MSVTSARRAGATGEAAARRLDLRRGVALFAASRVAVLAAGVLTAVLVSHPQHFGLGSVGDTLAAPVLNQDGRWFSGIALDGYTSFPHAAAYLPLYPLLISIAGPLGLGALAVFGALVSTVAFAAALLLLHKLVRLDFGERVATRTVVLTALFPTAVFFTALYAESLLLLLIVGAFYAARTERWALAGCLGALASATRVTALVLLAALACMSVFGPRGSERFDPQLRWRPRFPIRRDLLWIALVPAGYVAFGVYTLIALGDAAANLHAAPFWHVTFQGPGFAVVDGTRWAINAAGDLSSATSLHAVRVLLGHLASYAFLPFGAIAVVGAFRREPLAYAVYALVGLLPALSAYPSAHPLTSLQRYMAVLFPLQLWLALWASSRARYRACVAVSSVGLAACAALYATGHLA